MDLSVEQFEQLSAFIYQRTGLKFDLRKHFFVSKRAVSRMNALRMSTIDQYIRFLRFNDFDKNEFLSLMNLLTTNESYFFRDYPQLEAFAEHCLPEVIMEKKARNDNSLRIWSAGCSSGEEPYTIAIILHEILGNVADWDIEIIATDIDTAILTKAKIAEYDQRSIKDVPEEYLKKYFTEKRSSYLVNREITCMVDFVHQNLNEQKEIRNMKNFDFVFCRNVLIYFDEKSRKMAIENFYVSLNTGGYIFLGSSESVGRVSSAYVLKRKGDYLVYRKE